MRLRIQRELREHCQLNVECMDFPELIKLSERENRRPYTIWVLKKNRCKKRKYKEITRLDSALDKNWWFSEFGFDEEEELVVRIKRRISVET